MDQDKSDMSDQEKIMYEVFENVNTAIKKVTDEHAGENWNGIIECPACGKDLHVSIAGTYNNHVHGKCTTEGCLHWSQ